MGSDRRKSLLTRIPVLLLSVRHRLADLVRTRKGLIAVAIVVVILWYLLGGSKLFSSSHSSLSPTLLSSLVVTRPVLHWKTCLCESVGYCVSDPTLLDPVLASSGIPAIKRTKTKPWQWVYLLPPPPLTPEEEAKLAATSVERSSTLMRFVVFLAKYDPQERAVNILFMLYRLPTTEHYDPYDNSLHWLFEMNEAERLSPGAVCKDSLSNQVRRARLTVNRFVAVLSCPLPELAHARPDQKVTVELSHPLFGLDPSGDTTGVNIMASNNTKYIPASLTLTLCAYTPLPPVKVTWCSQPLRGRPYITLQHFIAWHAMQGIHRFFILDRDGKYGSQIAKYNQGWEKITSYPTSPLLIHLPFPRAHPSDTFPLIFEQVVAHTFARWHAGESSEWIATQDVDEYLVLPVPIGQTNHPYVTMPPAQELLVRHVVADSSEEETHPSKEEIEYAPSMHVQFRLLLTSDFPQSALGAWLSALPPDSAPVPDSKPFNLWFTNYVIRVDTVWMMGPWDGDTGGFRMEKKNSNNKNTYGNALSTSTSSTSSSSFPLSTGSPWSPPGYRFPFGLLLPLPRPQYRLYYFPKHFYRPEVISHVWHHGILLEGGDEEKFIQNTTTIRFVHYVHLNLWRLNKISSLQLLFLPNQQRDIELQITQTQVDKWVSAALSNSFSSYSFQSWSQGWFPTAELVSSLPLVSPSLSEVREREDREHAPLIDIHAIEKQRVAASLSVAWDEEGLQHGIFLPRLDHVSECRCPTTGGDGSDSCGTASAPSGLAGNANEFGVRCQFGQVSDSIVDYVSDHQQDGVVIQGDRLEEDSGDKKPATPRTIALFHAHILRLSSDITPLAADTTPSFITEYAVFTSSFSLSLPLSFWPAHLSWLNTLAGPPSSDSDSEPPSVVIANIHAAGGIKANDVQQVASQGAEIVWQYLSQHAVPSGMASPQSMRIHGNIHYVNVAIPALQPRDMSDAEWVLTRLPSIIRLVRRSPPNSVLVVSPVGGSRLLLHLYLSSYYGLQGYSAATAGSMATARLVNIADGVVGLRGETAIYANITLLIEETNSPTASSSIIPLWRPAEVRLAHRWLGQDMSDEVRSYAVLLLPSPLTPRGMGPQQESAHAATPLLLSPDTRTSILWALQAALPEDHTSFVADPSTHTLQRTFRTCQRAWVLIVLPGSPAVVHALALKPGSLIIEIVKESEAVQTMMKSREVDLAPTLLSLLARDLRLRYARLPLSVLTPATSASFSLPDAYHSFDKEQGGMGVRWYSIDAVELEYLITKVVPPLPEALVKANKEENKKEREKEREMEKSRLKMKMKPTKGRKGDK